MAVLGSSSSNPPLLPDVLLTVSTTWSPPYKVKALVRCFGGGGSGAASQVGYYNYTTYASTGGGAGEHAGSILELDPSVTYTIVAGAGGARRLATAVQLFPGLAGGTTSFSGSGITTITANGGAGGTSLSMPTHTTVYNLPGGAGGSGGAGALYRHTGGAGGAITKPAIAINNFNNALATGGGAVGLYGNGFAGGAITFYTTNNMALATGGGGVNGAGGASTVNSAGAHWSWGGSAFGPGGRGDTGAVGFNPMIVGDTTGTTVPPGPFVLPDSDVWEATNDFWPSKVMDRVNHTMSASTATMAPPGTGGCGRYNTHIAHGLGTGATLFGGGGAFASSIHGGTQDPRFCMGGKLGGGGGASGGNHWSSSYFRWSGYGGDGGVVIEMLERVL